MGAPRATYRLQLGPDLDFAAAGELVDYLAELGVSHLYLSPVLTARDGSTHGYDVADPRRVADALGGEEGLRALSARACAAGLGVVIDVVPNHVGTGPDNPLWEALLAEGPAGPSGRMFDVDWATPVPGAAGKVVLPILGEQYGSVLHAGELRVVAQAGRWRLRYHEHDLPLSPASERALDRAGNGDLLAGTPGDPPTWSRLHALLESQHYRLVHWRAGGRLINYRRFFAINELAAVRVEDPAVFAATHGSVVDLVATGVVDGLRVDHPDGLRDPARYLARLAEATDGAWVVVEKILEAGESLPGWPVAGTTGYDFANLALGLFVDAEAARALDDIDAAFGADATPYAEQSMAAKREQLETDLRADLRRLARAFLRVTQLHPEVRDVDDEQCQQVVAEVLVAMDVYRAYVDPETGTATDADIARVRAAVGRARVHADAGAPSFLYDFLAEVLTGRAGTSPEHLEMLGRFPQLASAVMAKGVEDTVFYRYLRLTAVNEVGGDPTRLGVTAAEFHEANAERARRHPSGMLTTATHDTKRGEDVRLRIAALSEMVDRWAGAVGRLRERHADLVVQTNRGPAPDPQTAYLVYQTALGVWPVGPGQAPGADVVARLQDYTVKAAREAKRRTTWTDPDEQFEDGVRDFVAGVLAPERALELAEVAGRAAGIAMVSGLAQTLLRATAPGVPDTYQGTELWDDSLVDPDNRRPVDFAARRRLLAELDAGTDPAELLGSWRDGRVKLWVLACALRARGDHPGAVGTDGAYVPVPVTGRWADHIIAYARVGHDGDALLVVVPRLPGRVMAGGGDPPVGGAWADTALRLPDSLADRTWSGLLAGQRHPSASPLPLAAVCATLPVALLSSNHPDAPRRHRG